MKLNNLNLLKTLAGLIVIVVAIYFFSLISKGSGQQSYEQHCAKCHGNQGEGIGGLVPPLYKADWLLENQDQLPCIIRYGLADTILVNGVEYSQQMLGNEKLSATQIANISNYIIKEFLHEERFYTQAEIEVLLEGCEGE